MMKNIILTGFLLILIACGKKNNDVVAPTHGCSTCKIFMTATTHDGNFGGVAAADSICATDANLPAGGGTYKALIGANTRFAPSTDWPLKASTTYVRSNGTTVIGTTTAARVFSFSLTNSLSSTSGIAWTGIISSTWAKDGVSCANWTTNAGAGNATNYGDSTQADGRSIEQGAIQCNSVLSLYCVEQ